MPQVAGPQFCDHGFGRSRVVVDDLHDRHARGIDAVADRHHATHAVLMQFLLDAVLNQLITFHQPRQFLRV